MYNTLVQEQGSERIESLYLSNLLLLNGVEYEQQITADFIIT